MSKCINKEDITIVIGTYNDRQTGQPKKQFRSIGELITMQNDDGSTYQFGKLWGASGVTEFKVFEQKRREQAVANAGNSQAAYQAAAQQPDFDGDIQF